ncbi:MAG TPA: hypothetical protein VM101_14270 [Flavitalea sp.]|nr:hypothetical protein [Flavitalea sp.]
MQKIKLVLILLILAVSAFAQDNQDETQRVFQKNRLFTGGSISFGLGTNTFQVGGNPVLGYSLAKWIDAGIVVNYNYNSYRDVVMSNDKLRSTTYGGGAFAQLYPLRFLFAHIQFEHNFIKEKYIPGNGGLKETNNVDANSLLTGVGVATERYPGDSRPFFYLMVLFDVLNDDYSPYTRSDGSVIPILRAGIHVPLFQGRKNY